MGWRYPAGCSVPPWEPLNIWQVISSVEYDHVQRCIYLFHALVLYTCINTIMYVCTFGLLSFLLCTYVYIYVSAYLYTCLLVSIHIHTHVCLSSTYKFVCTYVHTYIHIYIHAYVHAYMHTYVHSVYIYVYVYVCICICMSTCGNTSDPKNLSWGLLPEMWPRNRSLRIPDDWRAVLPPHLE